MTQPQPTAALSCERIPFPDVDRVPRKDLSADTLLELYVSARSTVREVGFKTGPNPTWSEYEQEVLAFCAEQLPILRGEIIRRMETELWTKP